MVIVIDAQIAGISGDMLLCSLVNMGADKNKIIEAIKLAEKHINGSTIKKLDFESVKKHGQSATSLVLDIDEELQERKAVEIQNCITNTIEKIELSNKAKKFAISSINTLMKAESKIHGESIDSVHFHEASSIDTVVDIVGTSIALDDLGFFEHEIITSPVAVGGGSINFSHGTTSNPTNAILEIFKNSGIRIVGGTIKEELTTPTGASLLVNLTSSCNEFYPSMDVNNIGYGAGKKEFDEFPNVLKIVKGKSAPNYGQDFVKIIETNVDDVSGEIMGFLIEKLMEKGAKDVTLTPAITKKGRPTNLISVICDQKSINPLVEILTSETGSLGLRIRTSQRIVVPRTEKQASVSINGERFLVHYKVSGLRPEIFKIEYEDIKSISNSLGKTFKQTEELITKELVKQ